MLYAIQTEELFTFYAIDQIINDQIIFVAEN